MDYDRRCDYFKDLVLLGMFAEDVIKAEFLVVANDLVIIFAISDEFDVAVVKSDAGSYASILFLLVQRSESADDSYGDVFGHELLQISTLLVWLFEVKLITYATELIKHLIKVETYKSNTHTNGKSQRISRCFENHPQRRKERT